MNINPIGHHESMQHFMLRMMNQKKIIHHSFIIAKSQSQNRCSKGVQIIGWYEIVFLSGNDGIIGIATAFQEMNLLVGSGGDSHIVMAFQEMKLLVGSGGDSDMDIAIQEIGFY